MNAPAVTLAANAVTLFASMGGAMVAHVEARHATPTGDTKRPEAPTGDAKNDARLGVAQVPPIESPRGHHRTALLVERMVKKLCSCERRTEDQRTKERHASLTIFIPHDLLPLDLDAS